MLLFPKQNKKILGRGRDKMARELLEAFHIGKRGYGCISDTPVDLKKTRDNDM